ncbi:coiled-coil domain-containing protein 22 homolog [Nematostella vectensis]|uniref:coiled-coil domain-containing protein 22 homolog n=1 Tax=Nematostella vectensis TaxID=45351 RepID=UPI0020773027|nr:coiled-coil domain-containing protein 22 homolog [Nematostella vectensis]
MEEVDNIIIHTLRQIGCEIPEEIQSLREFTTTVIVQASSKCLHVINEDIDIPSNLPSSMSAKFRVGTMLAAALQDLGYRGEIGYQTFLYSNEKDIRSVFMFLVEHLPKETSSAASEPLGSSVLLNRRVASDLAQRLTLSWMPTFLKKGGVRWKGSKPKTYFREGSASMRRFHACNLKSPQGLTDLTAKISKETKAYYSVIPYVTSQPPCRRDVAPSVLESNSLSVTAVAEWELEWNQSGLSSRLTKEEYLARKRQRLEKKIKDHVLAEMQRVEAGGRAASDLSDIVSSFSDRVSTIESQTQGSRFTRTEKLQFAQDEQKAAAMAGLSESGPPKMDTEEELQKKREQELEALQNKLKDLASSVDEKESEIKTINAGLQQTNEQVTATKVQNSEHEESYKVKKRTVDLLPDAENNIAKLQGVVDSSSQRLVNLAQQWETHRTALIDEYRELKVINAKKVSETQKKLEEIKSLREKMKEVAEETRGKDDLYKQLVSEYERMSRDVNRSAYTRRILEIVGNIKKQKEEINKILVDTKSVQKEINQLSGKLDRTFTVTDELIFRDAKKDEACRKAYKYLASLHENCKELIQAVEDTGVIMREIRDLEEQIDTESQKNTANNLERITADHKQMKEENATLTKKIKALKSS